MFINSITVITCLIDISNDCFKSLSKISFKTSELYFLMKVKERAYKNKNKRVKLFSEWYKGKQIIVISKSKRTCLRVIVKSTHQTFFPSGDLCPAILHLECRQNADASESWYMRFKQRFFSLTPISMAKGNENVQICWEWLWSASYWCSQKEKVQLVNLVFGILDVCKNIYKDTDLLFFI